MITQHGQEAQQRKKKTRKYGRNKESPAGDRRALSRIRTMLKLPARVDCESCDGVYEEVWDDDSDTIEDMAEPPVKDSECPHCGHVHKEMEWPGWMFRSEAG